MARQRATCFPPRQHDRPSSAAHFERHMTSWAMPAFFLALFRTLVALYIFATLVYSLVRASVTSGGDMSAAGRSFAYFTNLTYWGLGFYFAVSAGHGFAYCARGPTGLSATTGGAGDSRAKRVLRWCHGAYYATVTVYPFIVTLVAWTLLLRGALYDTYSTWLQVSIHALNSVFAGLEIFLPRTEPLAWIYIVPLVVLLAMYLGLTYVAHATTGTYVYPFLDVRPRGPGLVAGAIFGILIACVIFFALVHFVIRLRVWITEQKLGMKGHLLPPAARRQASDEVRMTGKHGDV